MGVRTVEWPGYLNLIGLRNGRGPDCESLHDFVWLGCGGYRYSYTIRTPSMVAEEVVRYPDCDFACDFPVMLALLHNGECL